MFWLNISYICFASWTIAWSVECPFWNPNRLLQSKLFSVKYEYSLLFIILSSKQNTAEQILVYNLQHFFYLHICIWALFVQFLFFSGKIPSVKELLNVYLNCIERYIIVAWTVINLQEIKCVSYFLIG